MPATHDKTGRARVRSGNVFLPVNETTTRKPWKSKIGRQFAPRTIEMLESPAFRVLTLSGHRVLARIEIELAHHGGKDNGRLPVTFDDFVAFGIDRHAIAPAIREVEALGFIEITEHGRAGNAEFRRPNKFRLTYRFTESAPETDEWKAIKTIEEASQIARLARGPITENRTKEQNSSVGKNPSRCGEPTLKHEFPQCGTPTSLPMAETPTTIDISGGCGPGEEAKARTNSKREDRHNEAVTDEHRNESHRKKQPKLTIARKGG